MRLVVLLPLYALAIVVRKPLVGDTKVDYLDHPSGVRLLVIEEQTLECKAVFRFDVGFLQDPRKLKGLTYVISQLLEAAISEKHVGHKSDPNSDIIADVREDSLVVLLRSSCERFNQDFETVRFILSSPNFLDSDLQKILGKMDKDERSLDSDKLYTFDDIQKMFSNPQTNFNYRRKGHISDLKNPGLMKAVNRFYNQNFKLSRLVVTMHGPKISILREIFSKAFEGLQPDSTPGLRYNSEQFFTQPQLNKLFYVKYPFDEGQITISIVFTKREHSLSSNPLNFIKYLASSNHKGSLRNILESSRWVSPPFSFSKKIIENYSEIRTTIYLSREGFRNRKKIISLFFDYFKFIARKWKSHIYNDYRQYQEIDFMLYNELNISYNIPQICDNIVNFGPERALSGNFDAGVDPNSEIFGIISSISPENAIVMIHTDNIKGGSEGLSKAPSFLVEKINLVEVDKLAQFELPPKQPYQVDLKKLEGAVFPSKKLNPDIEPQAIEITPKGLANVSRLYYFPDKTFGLPVCDITVSVVLDKAHLKEPLSHFVTDVASMVLEEKANEIRRKLSKARVAVSVFTTRVGFEFFVEGFSSNTLQNASILIELMKELSNFQIDNKKLTEAKSSYMARLKSSMCEYLYSEIDCNLGLIGDAPTEISEEKLSAILGVTPEQMTHHVRRLLDKFYPRVLVSGNVSKRSAKKVFKRISSSFSSSFKELKPATYSLYNMDSPYTLVSKSLYGYPLKSEVYDMYYIGTGVKSLVFRKIFGQYFQEYYSPAPIRFAKADDRVLSYSSDFYGHQVFGFYTAFPKENPDAAISRLRKTLINVVDGTERLTRKSFEYVKEKLRLGYSFSLSGIRAQHQYLVKRMMAEGSPLSSNWEVTKAIDAMTLEEFRDMATERFVTALPHSRVVITRLENTENLEKALKQHVSKDHDLYIGKAQLQHARKTYPHASIFPASIVN